MFIDKSLLDRHILLNTEASCQHYSPLNFNTSSPEFSFETHVMYAM